MDRVVDEVDVIPHERLRRRRTRPLRLSRHGRRRRTRRSRGRRRRRTRQRTRLRGGTIRAPGDEQRHPDRQRGHPVHPTPVRHAATPKNIDPSDRRTNRTRPFVNLTAQARIGEGPSADLWTRVLPSDLRPACEDARHGADGDGARAGAVPAPHPPAPGPRRRRAGRGRRRPQVLGGAPAGRRQDPGRARHRATTRTHDRRARAEHRDPVAVAARLGGADERAGQRHAGARRAVHGADVPSPRHLRPRRRGRRGRRRETR